MQILNENNDLVPKNEYKFNQRSSAQMKEIQLIEDPDVTND